VKTLLALALAAGCIGEKPKMPSAGPDPMQEALRRDFDGRADRPVTDRIPLRGPDGSWRSPDGKPITWTGVIGWTRPPQQDGNHGIHEGVCRNSRRRHDAEEPDVGGEPDERSEDDEIRE